MNKLDVMKFVKKRMWDVCEKKCLKEEIQSCPYVIEINGDLCCGIACELCGDLELNHCVRCDGLKLDEKTSEDH
jgi:hypothetical protein